MALILCVQVNSLELLMLLSPFASWQFDRDRDSSLTTLKLQVDDPLRPNRPTHCQFSLMESYDAVIRNVDDRFNSPVLFGRPIQQRGVARDWRVLPTATNGACTGNGTEAAIRAARSLQPVRFVGNCKHSLLLVD